MNFDIIIIDTHLHYIFNIDIILIIKERILSMTKQLSYRANDTQQYINNNEQNNKHAAKKEEEKEEEESKER